ncbi:MAG: hypothetical protein HYS26_03970 [Candidatus Kaiserbacteria bacterium]|nr:MAG: hypothetical protein HYS26_03970 [Candidatus Kaiserbacteria bacterium]
MAVNAEVQKTGSESTLSTIRKFSRRVQGTGLVKTVRNRRYYARDASKIVKKKRALKLIKRRAEYRKLVKEGKIAEAPVRPGRPSFNREGSQGSRFGESTPIAR